MLVSEIRTDFKVLTVSSKVFEMDSEIPGKYTCEGANVNPPIDIQDIPQEAKSLVLMVEDPDTPGGSWLHWLVWNIPPTRHIRESTIPGVQGVNDFGVNIYGGPCPPSGTHHYHFKVYALDTVLDLAEGSTRSEVELAMDNHILAFGSLVGLYRLRKNLAHK